MSNSGWTWAIAGWGVHLHPNPWFSLGLHIDHRAGFVDIHLPVLTVTVGNVRQIVWAETAYRDDCERCGGTGSYFVPCDCHDE